MSKVKRREPDAPEPASQSALAREPGAPPAKMAKWLSFSIDSIMQDSQERRPAERPRASPGAREPKPAKHAPSSSGSKGPSSTGDPRLSDVQCQLDNKEMWDKFHQYNTEMIITKTGRRMFPVMKVQFANLNPQAKYAVSMDVVPVDNKRYRYAYHKSCWQVAGKADPSAEPRLYPHPDSPFSGDLLTRQVISFEKVKLTNNEMDKSGHIILNSMHKYQPRIHLIELEEAAPPSSLITKSQAPSQNMGATKATLNHNHPSQFYNDHQHQTNNNNNYHTYNNHQHQESYHNMNDQAATTTGNTNPNHHHHHHQQQQMKGYTGYRTFVFPETVFTAVTAYQNQLITRMKIDKNPFAKGFRDSSRLSDLDRGDAFDYATSSARFMASQAMGGGGPSALADIVAGSAAAGATMEMYQQLLASAASPWFLASNAAAAAAAAAATQQPHHSQCQSQSQPPQPQQQHLAHQAPAPNQQHQHLMNANMNNNISSPHHSLMGAGAPSPLNCPPTVSSAAAAAAQQQAVQIQAMLQLAAFNAYFNNGPPPPPSAPSGPATPPQGSLPPRPPLSGLGTPNSSTPVSGPGTPNSSSPLSGPGTPTSSPPLSGHGTPVNSPPSSSRNQQARGARGHTPIHN